MNASLGSKIARHLAAVATCLIVVLVASAQEPAAPAGKDTAVAVDEWPGFRGDPAQRGVAAGSLPDALALRWTYQTGGAITSSAVIAAGRVYVGSDDQKLHAVDLESGEQVWAFETDDMIEAPPLVHEGIVYVGSSDLFFYAVDAASGELRWKYETDDKILGGANWLREGDETRIVVGSYDNYLYGFEAKTGALRWKYETANYVNGTPAVAANRAIFGGCDAVLHVVSAAGEAVERLELGEACHVAGSAAIADGRVYFGHYGNEFVCVDLEKAELVWYFPGRQAFFSSPAIGTDRVVFGGRDRKLHCAALADGEPLWSFPTRRKVDGSPVICGDKVVFGSGDGRLYVLKLEDGEELWSYEIGQSIFSSPAVAAGRIVIGAGDGWLYAFGGPKEQTTGDG